MSWQQKWTWPINVVDEDVQPGLRCDAAHLLHNGLVVAAPTSGVNPSFSLLLSVRQASGWC